MQREPPGPALVECLWRRAVCAEWQQERPEHRLLQNFVRPRARCLCRRVFRDALSLRSASQRRLYHCLLQSFVRAWARCLCLAVVRDALMS